MKTKIRSKSKPKLVKTTIFVKASRLSKIVLFTSSFFLGTTLTKASVLADWNAITAKVVKQAGQNSNWATRSFAIESIAVYDAVSSVKNYGQKFQYREIPKVPSSAQAAASYAAYSVLVNYFPTQKAYLDSILAKELAKVSDGSIGDAQKIGEGAALAIIQARSADGSQKDQNFKGDNITTVGHYQLTPTEFKPAINQYWATVSPFGLNGIEQFLLPPPPSVGSSDYAKALEQTKELGEKASTKRTSEQSHIAFFYNQDAELGVNEALRLLSIKIQKPIEQEALIYALVDIAQADARIIVWEAKYNYLFWRPVTALNANANGVVENKYEKWTPLLSTPAHPDYPSGHSATVTAGFEVLKHFYGDANPLTLHTTTAGEPPRNIQTLSQFEEENGLSRIYGGIHYSFDNTNAQDLGKKLARFLIQKYPVNQ